MTRTVNLVSDTVTQPTPEMREAMASAVVGDDGSGDDPTVNELQRRSAELLALLGLGDCPAQLLLQKAQPRLGLL